MKKHLSSIFILIIFLLGLALMLYPSVSDLYNTTLHEDVIAEYESYVETTSSRDYSDIWKQVDEYNEKLSSFGGLMSLVNGEPVSEEYKNLLDVVSGIMGYIEIPTIDVKLPIYHGTSDSILAAGVGHLEGSSLPGGGKGTHVVLAGHRGLPSSKLFTDLDKVDVGDVFYIHSLDRTMTYVVDSVRIVDPEDVSTLTIDPNGDYVTLVTCTPYGVNSHRLLVRGTRVDTSSDYTITNNLHIYKEAQLYDVYSIAPIAAVPLIILVALFFIFRGKRKTKYKKIKEIDHNAD